LDWTVTLTVLVLVMMVFAFANWRGRQPAQPLKVRMVNYHIVQMACIVVILVITAHMLTLYAGHPVTGQGRPY
jgi:ABC-type xylose transport system permease subunit